MNVVENKFFEKKNCSKYWTEGGYDVFMKTFAMIF